MATHDIMPWSSPRGGHDRVLTFRMGALSTDITTNTSFRAGEPMLQAVGTGDIDVIADGALNPGTNHYVAAASSQQLISLNGGTSGAATHNIEVPVWAFFGPDAGYFVTQYVVTGSDVQLTTAQKDAIFVGDTVGLNRDNTATGVANNGENGRFSVDTGGTGLKLINKLDDRGRQSDISGQPTVFFVVTHDA